DRRKRARRRLGGLRPGLLVRQRDSGHSGGKKATAGNSGGLERVHRVAPVPTSFPRPTRASDRSPPTVSNRAPSLALKKLHPANWRRRSRTNFFTSTRVR